MAINLNVTPYYNDFSANKKFNRVVFKPGVAVQARELTQMQDYFYETIKDMGEFLFSEGATIRGANADPVILDYIKINDTDASSATVSNDTLANYIGDELTGGTTGITARIHSVLSGVETETTAKKVLYLQYQTPNTTGAGDNINKRFDAGETLTVSSTDSGRNGDTFIVNSSTDNTSFTNNFYGQVIDFTIQEGVIFAQGKLVKHEKQTIRLDPYHARVNFLIGVQINETLTTSDDDATLLDPATGTYNYNAPGADRTKLTTTLTKVGFGDEYQNNRVLRLGEFVENQGNIYEVTIEGTTASSGAGPTHTTGAVTDGGVQFTYVTPPTNFSSVYKVVNGVLQKRANADLQDLAQLGKTLAQRTHEESGDYVVEPFTFKMLEHLKTVRGTPFNTTSNTKYGRGEFVNHLGKLYEVTVTGTSVSSSPPTHSSGEVLSGTAKFAARGTSYRIDNQGYNFSTDAQDAGDINYLVAKVSPGIAYVNGYRRRFINNSFVKVRKGTSTVTEESLTVPLGYGNFFECVEVCGQWDLEEGSVVQLGYYAGNAAAQAITDGTHGSHAAVTTVVATARVRQVRFASGTPGAADAKFRIFLYDIRVNNIAASSTDASLKLARTIYYSNGVNSGFADIVLTDTTGNGTGDSAVLKGVEHNRLVFPCPWKSTKTLYADGGSLDNDYHYTEEFDVTVAADGSFTISTSALGAGIQLPYSASPTQATLDSNFYLINKTNGQTVGGTGYDEGQQIRLTPSMVTAHATQSMSFDLGTVGSSGTAYLQVKVKVVDAAPVTKNLNVGRYVRINTTDAAGGANGPWSLGIADVQEIEAIYVAPASGNVYLDDDTGVDFKEDFTLMNGQTDNMYGHAKFFKNNGSNVNTTNAFITVKLRHFVPDYAGTYGTYFALNSYPIDDTGATGIYTAEIPIYKSQRLGTFDLRDCIDFRPYVRNTAVSATTLAASTENPYRTDEFELPTNGVQFPLPNSSFDTDVTYYLPRIDRLLIDLKGNIKVVEGVSEIPARPPVLEDGFMIGEIRISPYPSPAPNFAKIIDRIERAVYAKPLGQHRKYSMRDIGSIEKRISRLEYYLALSLLELDAKSKQILDANGLDRFKNGIYTNIFNNDVGSELLDPAYSASFNSLRCELSPFIQDDNFNLEFDSTYNTSDWQLSGGGHFGLDGGSNVSRPFTNIPHSQNGQYITEPKNLVSDLLFNYIGKMTVYPRSDVFKDSQFDTPLILKDSNKAEADALAAASSGDVVGYETSFDMGVMEGNTFISGGVNKDTETISQAEASEASLNMSAPQQTFGASGLPMAATRWGGWFEQTQEGTIDSSIDGTISATSSFDVTTSTQSIVQQSTEILLQAKSQPAGSLTFPIGNVVRDVSLISHMRDITILFRISGLKPSLQELFVFFDGEDVSNHCFGLDVDSFDAQIQAESQRGTIDYTSFAHSMGGWINLPQSNTEGEAAIAFKIPRNRFPIGERRIFVCDDPQQRDNFITTQAEGQFSAYGMQSLSQDVTLVADLHTVTYGTSKGQTLPPKSVGEVITDVEMSNLNVGIETKDLEYNIDVTSPTYIYHPPIIVGDPLAQSFSADTSINGQGSAGFYLDNVKVWFKRRPGQKHQFTESATLPSVTRSGHHVTMTIRKMNQGYPSNVEVARTRLYYTDVKTTPDLSFGNETAFDVSLSTCTTFSFEKAPFLHGSENYCFVLEPSGNNPDYEVWTFKLGSKALGQNEDIIVTKDNVMPQGASSHIALGGVMFTSSNNRTWSPIQGQDIKYLMDMRVFKKGTGTAQWVNADYEFIKGKDYISGRPKDGGVHHGVFVALKNAATTAGSGHAVGDVITMADKSVTYSYTNTRGDSESKTLAYNGIKVEVTTVSGSGGVTGFKFLDYGIGLANDSDLWGTYDGFVRSDQPLSTPILTHAPGAVTQGSSTGSGTGFAMNLSKAIRGQVDHVNGRTEEMMIQYNKISPRKAFEDGDLDYLLNVGDFVQLYTFQGGVIKAFTVDSIFNKVFNNHRVGGTNKVHVMEGNSVTNTVATTNATGISAAGTTFESVIPSMRMKTLVPKAIYSLRNEAAFTGANKQAKKSYKVRCTMKAGDDTSHVDSAGVEYSASSPHLNNNRMNVLTQSYAVNNDSTNETTNNGNALSKFISKKVRLADGQDAEDIKVSVAHFTPPGSSFEVYFKGMAQEDDADFLRDLEWVKMEFADSNQGGSSEAEKAFIDFDFKLPSTVLNSDGQFNYTTNRIKAVTITASGGGANPGYASLSEVDIIVASSGVGEEASIKATALNGTGGISAVEIMNPGRGFSGAPTITVGYPHEVSRQYAAGVYVANGGQLYKCTIGGTTGAASASSAPSHTGGTSAADGGCTWEHRGPQPTMTCTVDGVNYSRFKYFSIKMVMLTSNSSMPPKAKQLRAIALQA